MIESFFSEHGVNAFANNYSVMPIPAGGKKTYWKRWQQYCHRRPSCDEIDLWARKYSDWSVAFLCDRHLVAIDIDALQPDVAERIQEQVFDLCEPTPLVRTGEYPKRLLVYQTREPIRRTKIAFIDILGIGSYFVGFGIHPKTLKPYTWADASPATLDCRQLPIINESHIVRLRDAIEEAFGDKKCSQQRSTPTAPPRTNEGRRDDPSPNPERIRPFQTKNWLTDGRGIVTDGRDTFLAHLVWIAAQREPDDAATIGREAWAAFRQQADLQRPKRDGRHPWTMNDAIVKAAALLRRGKLKFGSRPRAVHPGGVFWTAPAKNTFSKIIDAAGADRRLSPAAVTVSRLMLGLIYADDTCYASVERIAEETGYSIPAVKKARQQLRERGYWEQRLAEGGRGHLANYTPNPAALVHEVPVDTSRADRQRVYVSGSAIFQGEGVEEEPEDWTFILFEEEESHTRQEPQSHQGVHQVPTNSPSSTADAVVEVPGDHNGA